VRQRIPKDATQLEKLRLLNQYFFNELKFGGNVNDFYDPDNSFIHCVLNTRRGIPISLGLLWMELAQGLGLSVRGVSFPGHFLVKANFSVGQVVIDPTDGRSLSREDLSEMLEPLRQDAMVGHGEVPLGLYLKTALPREIIARMLHNLKDIHSMQCEWKRVLAVQERLIVLMPESWAEYRDRGLAHAELGHTQEALADLECFLVHTEDEAGVDVIARRVEALRRIT
jgi:regulator of sirC expression with transglutaminase-like and TPR domain